MNSIFLRFSAPIGPVFLAGCLLLAEPPNLTTGGDAGGGILGGGDVCDDLEACCGRLGVEDWERDACYSHVSYGEESTCLSALCNWASRDDACVPAACDNGCAVSGC